MVWMKPKAPKSTRRRRREGGDKRTRSYSQGVIIRPGLISIGMEMERFLGLIYPRSPLYRYIAYAFMVELKYSEKPVVSITTIKEKYGLPHASFYRALRALRKVGIVRHGYKNELKQFFLAHDFSNALKRLAGRYEEFLAESDRAREEKYLGFLREMAEEYFPDPNTPS